MSQEAEIEGIDMPEFGAYCYPDFVLQRETFSRLTTSGDRQDVGSEVGAGPPTT